MYDVRCYVSHSSIQTVIWWGKKKQKKKKNEKEGVRDLENFSTNLCFFSAHHEHVFTVNFCPLYRTCDFLFHNILFVCISFSHLNLSIYLHFFRILFLFASFLASCFRLTYSEIYLVFIFVYTHVWSIANVLTANLLFYFCGICNSKFQINENSFFSV